MMNKSKKLGVRDLLAGGQYLHLNGDWIRTILAIDGDTVQWRDQFGRGCCSRRAFLQRCPTVAPSDTPDLGKSQATTDLSAEIEFTLRDEANALTAFAFRNGFIEELHAGKDSPLLRQPEYSRISDDEMRRLMIESSQKLEKMLRLRKSDPEKYDAFVRDYHEKYCRRWRRD